MRTNHVSAWVSVGGSWTRFLTQVFVNFSFRQEEQIQERRARKERKDGNRSLGQTPSTPFAVSCRTAPSQPGSPKSFQKVSVSGYVFPVNPVFATGGSPFAHPSGPPTITLRPLCLPHRIMSYDNPTGSPVPDLNDPEFNSLPPYNHTQFVVANGLAIPLVNTPPSADTLTPVTYLLSQLGPVFPSSDEMPLFPSASAPPFGTQIHLKQTQIRVILRHLSLGRLHLECLPRHLP